MCLKTPSKQPATITPPAASTASSRPPTDPRYPQESSHGTTSRGRPGAVADGTATQDRLTVESVHPPAVEASTAVNIPTARHAVARRFMLRPSRLMPFRQTNTVSENSEEDAGATWPSTGFAFDLPRSLAAHPAPLPARHRTPTRLQRTKPQRPQERYAETPFQHLHKSPDSDEESGTFVHWKSALGCTSVHTPWWRGQDLNLRPSGYEPDELPRCSTPHWHPSERPFDHQPPSTPPPLRFNTSRSAMMRA